MKKTRLLSCLLALALVLALALPVLAAETETLNIVKETVRGNSAWTPESYPEIWLTPYFAEYVIEGNEKYPPVFLRIAPPEGSNPLEFSSDSASFIDFDTLMGYYYYVTDSYAFELFLEDVAEEDIMQDGSDGVAMFVQEDSRRAKGLVDIKDDFGKSSKLFIELYDNTGKLSVEEKRQALEAEVARVQANSTVETLDHYWSEGVFGDVQLFDTYDDIIVVVDATGLTVTKIEDEVFVYEEKNADGKMEETKIELNGYAGPYYREEQGETDGISSVTLEDGTEMKTYNTEYTGYAAVVALESDHFDNVLYLSITSDCSPDAFPAKLQTIYNRITIYPEGLK